MLLNKKKIIFVITDFGSFNNFLGDTAVALSREGHEIFVISSSTKVIKIEDKFDYKKEGINIIAVDLPRGFNPISHYKASKKIHKIINVIVPDIVSIHFTTGIFTTTFNGRLKFKTIGTIHGLGYPVVEGVLKKKLYKFIEKRSLKNIDEAWVLNKTDLFLIKKDFPKVPVYQIPTKGVGCDLGRFDPSIFSKETTAKLKLALNIGNNDFVICFTGRFVSFKGFDNVVKAFRILIEKEKENNLKLILIGGKDEAHLTGLIEEEEIWMNECDLIINVGFSSKVEEYLSVTDLFVFPSEKEGMPVCIIEALAMNIPVITANARGCNDLISDGVNGVLLEKNSPNEIAKQILVLKNNKQIYNKMRTIISEQREQLDRGLFVDQQVNYFTKL